MPRIANGRVVDDKPAEKREAKNRVLTWGEFTKAPRGGAKAPNELRSRPTDEKKTTDEHGNWMSVLITKKTDDS